MGKINAAVMDSHANLGQYMKRSTYNWLDLSSFAIFDDTFTSLLCLY